MSIKGSPQEHASWIKEYDNRRYQTQLIKAEFVPHQREFHIVALIMSGELHLNYRERDYLFHAGEAVIIPAGEIHAFSTKSDKPAIVTFHYIDTLDALSASDGIVFPTVESPLITKALAKNLVPHIFIELEKPLDSQYYHQWLKGLVKALSEHLEHDVKLGNCNIQAFVAAKNYIQENIDQPFSLEEISSRFNIDKWSLSRKFRHIFGVTLFQHIHAARMVKAKNLLSQKLAISTVAIDLGYSDQSHFTRFFKRFVGISPKQWVKLVSPSNVEGDYKSL